MSKETDMFESAELNEVLSEIGFMLGGMIG